MLSFLAEFQSLQIYVSNVGLDLRLQNRGIVALLRMHCALCTKFIQDGTQAA